VGSLQSTEFAGMAEGGVEPEVNVDQKVVRMLEDDIEDAIAAIIIRHSKGWKVPLLPSQRTMHLMAKAAAAVHEAAVEAREGGSRSHSISDS
jgi:hypothetical protein